MNKAIVRFLNAQLHNLHVQASISTWFDFYVEINDRQSNAHDQLVKETENVLKNRQWSGTTSATLQQHTGVHQKACVNHNMHTKTVCKRGSPCAFCLVINPCLHMGILIYKRGSPYAYIHIWASMPEIPISNTTACNREDHARRWSV